jgi:hypothetical protein
MGFACQAFFNVNIIYDSKPCLESFADKCLSPVRCLFNGRDVKKIDSELSYPDRSAGQIALAVLLFIPSIIFGTLAKLFAMVYSKTRGHQQLISVAGEMETAGEKGKPPFALIGRFFSISIIQEKISEEKREMVAKFLEIIPKLEAAKGDKDIAPEDMRIAQSVIMLMNVQQLMEHALFD